MSSTSPSAAPSGAPARPRVLVLFGGRSSEHGISCLSAGNVLALLDRDAFDVVAVGITRAGAWVLVDDAPEAWRLRGRDIPEVTDGEPVTLLADPSRPELVSLAPGRSGGTVARIDVVLPVLHGPGGEDGELQGVLETAGLPYVGSGVCASAASMDKAVTKALLRDAGIPVGDAVVLPRDRPTLTDAERDRLGLPVFVKPARGGSSLGISRVTAWDQLDAAITEARRSDPKVLVEASVTGREIECGVLQFPDGRMAASVLGEIRVTGGAAGWYDFDTKYLDDAAELDVPAKVDDATAEAVRELALRVAAVMEVEGIARVDFFLTPDGAAVVNELNTMPGFTATSGYPRMWATSGIEAAELGATLIATALARGTGVR